MTSVEEQLRQYGRAVESAADAAPYLLAQPQRARRWVRHLTSAGLVTASLAGVALVTLSSRKSAPDVELVAVPLATAAPQQPAPQHPGPTIAAPSSTTVLDTTPPSALSSTLDSIAVRPAQTSASTIAVATTVRPQPTQPPVTVVRPSTTAPVQTTSVTTGSPPPPPASSSTTTTQAPTGPGPTITTFPRLQPSQLPSGWALQSVKQTTEVTSGGPNRTALRFIYTDSQAPAPTNEDTGGPLAAMRAPHVVGRTAAGSVELRIAEVDEPLSGTPVQVGTRWALASGTTSQYVLSWYDNDDVAVSLTTRGIASSTAIAIAASLVEVDEPSWARLLDSAVLVNPPLVWNNVIKPTW